jgi:hypothetical protein
MNGKLSIVAASCLFILACGAPVRGQDDAEARREFEQAQALAKQQKLEEAIVAMKKAVRLDPRNDRYLAVLSEMERLAGRPGDALGHAREAVRLNDKVAIYYALVAADAYADQDVELARAYCQTALKRGAAALGAAPYRDMQVLEGLLRKRTFTVVWNLDTQKGAASAGAITVTLPKGDLPYQTLTYRVTGARSQKIVRQEGNDLLRLVPDGANSVRLTTRITTLPFSYKQRLARRTRGSVPSAARAYLGSVDDIDVNSARVNRIVANLRGKDDLERVQRILAWMKKNVRYKFEGKDVWGLDYKSADDVLERGYAECRGYSVAFTTLCRAANVPARLVWGLEVLPPAKAADRVGYGSHNWAEVYLSGVGWLPVDPQKPETLGFLPNNYLRGFMFTRRSLSTPENLPLLNLVTMNGDHVEVEETR